MPLTFLLALGGGGLVAFGLWPRREFAWRPVAPARQREKTEQSLSPLMRLWYGPDVLSRIAVTGYPLEKIATAHKMGLAGGALAGWFLTHNLLYVGLFAALLAQGFARIDAYLENGAMKRQDVVLQMADVVEALEQQAQMRHPLPRALSFAASVSSGQMGQELTQLAARIGSDSRTVQEHLDAFAIRMQNPFISELVGNLKAWWDAGSDPEGFKDLTESLKEERDSFSSIRSKQATNKMLLPIVLSVLAVLIPGFMAFINIVLSAMAGSGFHA